MKYSIVTGGTKGIGKQVCIDLLRKGYYVITNYASDEVAAENAKKEFFNYSDKFCVFKADQSNVLDLQVFVEKVKSVTNEIHCIICNTGITLRKDFRTTSNDEWEKVFMVNVHSHFYLIRDIDSMIQKKSKIIFIGSVLGELPHATSLPYGVTKAAVHALASNLVKDYADRDVTVNVVAPGFVETEWQSEKPISIRESIYGKTALKRFASVEEVSMSCMMIIDNDFINGSTIKIDGGYNYR